MTQAELKEPFSLNEKIERLQSSLDEIHETGGVGARKFEIVVREKERKSIEEQAIELSSEIDELKSKLKDQQIKIQKTIDRLELSEIEKKVLMMRYVDCKKWKYISMRIGYSEGRTMVFHRRAKDILIKTLVRSS